MNRIKLAARLALNDAGEQIVAAIKALDAGEYDDALDAMATAADLFDRATELTVALADKARAPS